jgi:hypothetical protein
LVSTTCGRGGVPDIAGERDGFGVVDLLMDFPRGPRELSLGQMVLLLGVVRGVDGDWAQGDHLRATNDADLLAARRAGEPGSQVLPGTGDRQRFHAGAIRAF